MIDHELVERITRLSMPDRLELIELLTRSLRTELQPTAPTRPDLTEIKQFAQQFNLDVPPSSSLHQLLGVIPAAAVPTTKEAVRDLIGVVL